MLVRSSICLNRMGVSNNQQRRRLKSKEARGKEGVICRKEMDKARHSLVHEHSRHANHLDAHRQVVNSHSTKHTRRRCGQGSAAL